jgi:hypothetical protein
VQVPERVADLIGQLAGAVGAAPVSGRRAGHAVGGISAASGMCRGCPARVTVPSGKCVSAQALGSFGVASMSNRLRHTAIEQLTANSVRCHIVCRNKYDV